MSKWRKWALVAVCAVLGIVLFTVLTRGPEPAYKGKTLSQWLEYCAYEGADDDANGQGAEAIRAIGTNALPYLVSWVSYDSSRSQSKNSTGSWRRKLPKSTPANVRLWVMEDRNETKAGLACLGFELLGERANSVIPELTTVMNNQAATNRSLHAAMALTVIGKEAIPSLSAQLANTNCSYRKVIAGRFGAIEGLATNESVVTALLRSLNDPDPVVVSFAAGSLGRLAERDRSHAAEVVPALTNCLASALTKSARSATVRALGVYGTEAQDAVPLLRVITADPDEMVREAATNALLRIAPWELTNAPAVVPDLRGPPGTQ